MSLFKTQEWWSNNDFGGSDELSPRGALLATISNSLEDQIILGFNSGILRILDPRKGEGSMQDGILLEVKLEEPILELAYGKFVGSSLGLAVLHPKSLDVYAPQTKSSKDNVLRLELAYRHSLKSSAYNFCVGPFGGAKQRDYLCIQTLDGSLIVYEQETFGFLRNLSERFILPSPIVYTQRTDSFVVFSSDFQLTSYKYQSLAIKSNGENEAVTSESWSVDLSDEILEIQEIASSTSSQPSTIIALCMSNLFILYDTGVILFTKKLQFNPISLLIYLPQFNIDEESTSTIIAIASDSKSLYLMENTTLKWITQLPFVPLRIFKGNFSSDGLVHRGLLSLISSNGTVSISYLGTNPSFFVAPPLEKNDCDIEKVNEEVQQLYHIIDNINKPGEGSSVSQRTSSESIMKIETRESLEKCFYSTNYEDSDKVMLCLRTQIHVSSPVQNVKVSYDAPQPFRVEGKSSFIPEIKNEAILTTYIYLLDAEYPPRISKITIRVVFFANESPFILKKTINIPLNLSWKPIEPLRDASFKITLNTSSNSGSPPFEITDVFEEYVLDSSMTNAVGFVLGHSRGPNRVTILASKSSQRYRIQSDDLSCLWIFVREFVHRLKEKYGITPTYNSTQLPLNEYVAEIERHTMKRAEFAKLEEGFAQQSALFRAIEKRLLNRFKDKTPGHLTSLDTLLESTYRRVQRVLDLMESAEEDIKVSGCKLACMTATLHQLIRLYPNSKSLEVASALTTHHDSDWEERTDGILGYYLGYPSSPYKDLNRLKKRIYHLIDRVFGDKEGNSSNPRAPIAVLNDEFDDAFEGDD